MVEHNSLLLKDGLHTLTSFQRALYGKGKSKRSFTVEKPDKHYLSRVLKGKSAVISMFIVCALALK